MNVCRFHIPTIGIKASQAILDEETQDEKDGPDRPKKSEPKLMIRRKESGSERKAKTIVMSRGFDGMWEVVICGSVSLFFSEEKKGVAEKKRKKKVQLKIRNKEADQSICQASIQLLSYVYTTKME